MLTFLTILAMTAPAPHAVLPQKPLACITMNTDRLPLATRKSPLDSLSFKVGAAEVKLCYGRPSAGGRTMKGTQRAVPAFGPLVSSSIAM